MTKFNPDFIAQESQEWKDEKPTESGIYWVRGFCYGRRYDMALVEVSYFDGDLICNLHRVNSERDKENWPLVSELSDKFEWLEA